MEVSRLQLILVAVLITGQADAVPERSRRNEEHVPLNGQVKTYPVSNTEDRLSADDEEGSIGKAITLQPPETFSFDTSKQDSESSETEANVLTEYDGDDKANADKNNIKFKPHSSAFANFQKKFKTKNRRPVQYGETSENLPPAQEKKKIFRGKNPLLQRPSVHSGYMKNAFITNPNNVPSSNPSYVGRVTYEPVQNLNLGYKNNENWNPYTKPAEGNTLIKSEGEILSRNLNSEMQYKPPTQDNIVAQTNDGLHYSEEHIATAAEVAAEGRSNIDSSYGGSLHTQMDHGMRYNGAQESSMYGNTNQYNNGYLDGPGNANSNLQNRGQFGGLPVVQPPGQAGPVLESRFGQPIHPGNRPIPGVQYGDHFVGGIGQAGPVFENRGKNWIHG